MNRCLECNLELTTRKQRKFCSGRCQKRLEYREYIARWLRGQEAGTKGWNQVSNHIKRWLFEQRGAMCWICSWDKIHPIDNKCPLEVDHIDGKHENNRPENLRLLCPNCHALTPTYKNRNKGNGRQQRRDRYKNCQTY
jgi:hypothetical protein